MDLLIVYLFKIFRYDKNIGLYMYLYMQKLVIH